MAKKTPAKKKKAHKKIRRSASPARAAVGLVAAAAPVAVPASAALAAPLPALATPAPRVALPVSVDRWSYVRLDLRRVAAWALAGITLEAIAWFLLNHTGLGSALYNSIKL